MYTETNESVRLAGSTDSNETTGAQNNPSGECLCIRANEDTAFAHVSLIRPSYPRKALSLQIGPQDFHCRRIRKKSLRQLFQERSIHRYLDSSN